ncbi:glycosyltransferase family A protein [Jiangella endophytica]|uniref:glycosyltransferase family A protein n=1 Tax=Jiangella endophytica TaxID=1623398 RepID=UPI000E34E809|nr:glycosyltransferase family A protein [Jiangella endophytica]
MSSTARGAVRRLRRAARELRGVAPRPATPTPSPAPAAVPADRGQQIREVRDLLRDHLPREAVAARPGLRVAVAASPRLADALAWEWDQTVLEPGQWSGVLEPAGAELVLVEAQSGHVPGWGPADGEPARLVAAAAALGLPVVVWVTSSSGDTAGLDALVDAAAVVFVADPAAAVAWREHKPDAVVEVLPPAAAPMQHSPVLVGGSDRRPGAAAFVSDQGALDPVSVAGLESLVAPAVGTRALPELHAWRARGRRGAVGAEAVLPAAVKPVAVGSTVAELSEPIVDHYRVFVDAARSSPESTWSLLDAAAAQTAVVTLPEYRAALPEDLRSYVATADQPVAFGREIIARLAQPELRDREALQLHRAVLAGHTLGHRVDAVLAALGRPVAPFDRSVSIVVPTNREHELDNVFANVARQAHRDNELILVLHGLGLDHADLHARAKEHGVERLQVIDADSSAALGTMMNLGVDAASGRYTAKMDDDNFYGRHYLTDLVHAFASTDAGIVGKWAHYVWLRSVNAVVLRYAGYQHRYYRLVQGGSIMADTELAKDLRFSDIPRAVDTDFLNRAWASGVRTYSSDRFNFVSIRGTDHEAHTWKVTDTEMMIGGGQVAFYGDPRVHVDV